MLKNNDWSVDRNYKTGGENEPLQFYLEGLGNSSEFHLLLGYFSSAAIHLLSVGFATFIAKGGKMRMVINHLLSEQDKEFIKKGQNADDCNKTFDLSNVVALEKTLNEYDKHFFECLAYLISKNRITIKVIKPKDKKGIAHYKSGVFCDKENQVGYKASCNFTLYGLSENLEELEAFLSWENGRSNKLIEKQLKLIDNYFSEIEEDVEYLSANEIEVAIKNQFKGKDLEELLVQEQELIEKKKNLVKNNKLKKTIDKLYDEIDKIRTTPKFPFDEPREYQQIAFEHWNNNKQQGLFAMATGTGKTITALNCLLEVYKKTGYYKSLVLVPTITLVNQWENECKKFNFSNIVKISSKSKKWENNISVILTQEKLCSDKECSFIVISTYASFRKKNIFTKLNQLSSKTLFIADECHNIGANCLLNLLPKIKYELRIGLSATPERQYDEEGNKKIRSFFNSENKYTYEYSMKDAINNKVLCRYYYYPHLVSLTESEMKEYVKLSRKIVKFYRKESENFRSDRILTLLLLKRKRIIHKAFNKISVFHDILQYHYRKNGNLKHTLIYVPEGNDENDYFETDRFIDSDEIETDVGSLPLIDVFSKKVRGINDDIMIRQFIAQTEKKEQILEQFADGEIDVLTSMKCLDEGVDIPQLKTAVFCASTGNPRQFIQRRGRILRKHLNKQFAYIHDLVVIPKVNNNSDSYSMERNLLKKELKRVNDFSSLAENSSDTVNTLFETIEYYNLNLYHNE
ncbi:MAG: DEAD/DEAH box helicase family protein [Flavobacteriaceae bacterium]|nr:DEAD/DEAH box helicase family protein [Flavobacteriaceae bacterium]